jgi:hypothetical protein
MEALVKYTGTAFVFSGQRDPVWEVSKETTKRLEALWETFELLAGSKPYAPPLGYKGCALRHGTDLEYTAYGGVVTRKMKNEFESRRDKGRSFEKLLLQSAPEGVFPKDLMPW